MPAMPQKMPIASNSHPIGVSGRRSAISNPTTGKVARISANASSTASLLSPQPLLMWALRVNQPSTPEFTQSANAMANAAQAIHRFERALIARLCPAEPERGVAVRWHHSSVPLSPLPPDPRTHRPPSLPQGHSPARPFRERYAAKGSIARRADTA